MINFLTMLFDEGKSFSAINTARSALSAFMWDNNSGQTIGNLCSVKRLLKGMYELRPPKPRYSCIWDANIVLSYLSNFYPNEDIPLSLLSYKLVMLIALASAQRAQTIHKIYVDRIDFSDDLVIIPICNLIKQSKPGRKMISLRLKPYENPSICVLKVLKEYINRTRLLRQEEKQLFISFVPPHKAVSKNTISRWLKKVLEEAGIEIDIFKAHSTRAASCSRAKRDNVNIDEILETAGWTNQRTFERFYDKVIMN